MTNVAEAVANETPQVGVDLRAAETAIAAIDTLLTMSMWGLGILALFLAFIAVFGWLSIRNAAVNTAKDIAGNRLDTYIEGGEFSKLVEQKLQEVIERRWQDTLVVHHLNTPEPKPEDSGVFPHAKKDDGGSNPS